MNPPPESSDDPPTASRKQAAIFLGKTVNTLWRYSTRADQMGLPVHRKANGEIFYYWVHLRLWNKGARVVCDCGDCEAARSLADHPELLTYERG